MIKDPNHDPEPDNGPDNNGPDNGPDHDKAVVPTLPGGARTSLRALEVALGKVDTSAIGGRSGLPLLQFKREGDGTWMYGQKKTVVEAGSRWAANPATFMWGYVCFGEGNKRLGEHLVSVSKPRPDVTTLPDHGFKWQEEMAVNMKCVSGVDNGLEVVCKMSTDGGVKVINGLLNEVLDRVLGGQHDGKVAPIMLLEKDSYQHAKHGRVWYPVTPIVEWMPLEGPAPEPAPASPPPSSSSATEQPRRRRVA